MKIPTKHINTKHTFMFAGALAAVVTLAPAAAFAYGGGEARDGRSSGSHERRSGDSHKAKTANNTHHKKSGYNKHYYHYGGNFDAQKWWGWLTADKFQKMHDAKLAWLDKIVADKNLTVENGEVLRADLVTKADSLKTELTALEQLKASIDKENMTDEQKVALKAQTLTTFEAFYDYYESLYTYKAAVKVAAEAENTDAGINLEKED
jgi:hypothetical protein